MGAGEELEGCSTVEKRLRRGVGKLLGGPRKATTGTREELLALLKNFTEAGLEVQQVGLQVGEERREELIRLQRRRRLGLKYGRSWRKAVLMGGAARAATLAHWKLIVEAAWSELPRVVGTTWVGLQDGTIDRITGKLESLIKVSTEVVRGEAARTGLEDDARWLAFRAFVRGWRHRAASNQRGEGRRSMASAHRCVEAEKLLEEACQEWQQELGLEGGRREETGRTGEGSAWRSGGRRGGQNQRANRN